ncbi:MAG: hypothetical protein QM779_08230 [Propionicimonas sp.]|uniref:hypothetical protein n=1 Tax=Propionicimonas sp. TaxID=1955623 RepID=UPI003D104251
MTDPATDAATDPEDQLSRVVREVIAQLDAGHSPSAQGIAAAVDLDETAVRNMINFLGQENHLRGERHTNEARPLFVTWVSDELRAEFAD